MALSSMESKSKVCVTGGSGYIGSWLVKKLLEKGYTVHATLINLGEASEVSFLKSLPNADTRLVLFQADIYNTTNEFELAINGCEFVFHVATPMNHSPQSTQYKDTTEAAVGGVKIIADSCVRSRTVKRLIYTASVTALSPLKEDGFGFKSCLDESCWTPLNLSYKYSSDWMLAYMKSKTLAEKEALSYNENKITGDQFQVVSLACGLVAGGTLDRNHVSGSMGVVLSQLTGNLIHYEALKFMQELFGSIPLIHVDDVCEAHIFCMEKPIIEGRFLCSAVNATMKEIADFYRENYPKFKIVEDFRGGVVEEEEEQAACKWDYSKLVKEGFEYKYDLKKIIDDTVESARRLGALTD